ncbi:hypothetical protein [Gordonia zhaorongruii]|uniref:hypothetical protein n=1 Tax=Gordonia zhaorongruii TaxID=2597659 RepID=UPI00104F83D2|nr:hypothetical protein [Gordonia zhaorongruii]
MLAEVAIIPGAPVLVPELSGPNAVEVEPVRAAVLAAGRALADAATCWIAIGADGPDRRLAAYGADVPVTLTGNGPDLSAPSSMLIAAWLRGRTESDVEVVPLVVDATAAAGDAAVIGRRLAARVDADPRPIGVLVVADGANALSPSAPGGGDREAAHALQTAIDDALAAGDTASLATLDRQRCAEEGAQGRAALQVLSALWGAASARAQVRYSGAPLGVGYSVVTWRPERR